MTFKHFRLNCVVRIILLAASIFLLTFLIMGTSLYATTAVVGIVILAQIVSLTHYIEKTNRELTRFLASIRYSDFSQSFSSSKEGESFKDLHTAFSDVVSEFQRARAEKEEQYRYLQILVQHVGLGILSFERDGTVDLINHAAKRLLNVTQLNNVKALESRSAALVKALMERHSSGKELVSLEQDGETPTLAIYATEFKLRDRPITLVSMQNIADELAEQEMAAWQKLIRVLTHEIMNSVTPIASLAGTVNQLVAESEAKDAERPAGLSGEMFDDISTAVATIEKRSRGLLHFIDAYRNLTRIPTPKYQKFPVADLIERVKTLMADRLSGSAITMRTAVEPDDLELVADPELIEQVLINLVLNAIQAVEEADRKEIEVATRIDDRTHVLITVSDSAASLSDDLKDKIFTPFFTTRKGGSGIGLSLSRQIMRLHKGNITARTIPNEKTIITLRF